MIVPKRKRCSPFTGIGAASVASMESNGVGGRPMQQPSHLLSITISSRASNACTGGAQ